MLSEITAGRALLAVRSQICQGKAWSIQHPPVAVSERARCLGVPLSCGAGLISAAAGGAVSGPLAHRPPSHAPAGMVRAVGHGAVVEGHHRAREGGSLCRMVRSVGSGHAALGLLRTESRRLWCSLAPRGAPCTPPSTRGCPRPHSEGTVTGVGDSHQCPRVPGLQPGQPPRCHSTAHTRCRQPPLGPFWPALLGDVTFSASGLVKSFPGSVPSCGFVGAADAPHLVLTAPAVPGKGSPNTERSLFQTAPLLRKGSETFFTLRI